MKAIFSMSLTAAVAVLALSAPVRAANTDAGIVSSARQSYVFKHYLTDADVKIESKDGAVTLTGLVDADYQRALAKEVVLSLPGVKRVDNRLEVKGAPPTANSDAWLHEKVKATLLFHWSVSAATTEVDVKDGIVTLRGSAVSQAQKELTAEYARDVEGVNGVKNDIAVFEAPKKKPLTTREKIDDVSVSALVRMALLLHHSTNALYTTVAVKRGVITVSGKAKTEAEKSLVTRIVKDVSGVKGVNNLMSVE